MAAPTDPAVRLAEQYGGEPRPLAISGHVARILCALGEDPGRDGLLETPKRVEKFLSEATRGYREDPATLLKTFDNDGGYPGMVNVGPIPFYSLCEHHVVPFFGQAWVAYIPGDKIVGLSKLARLVDVFAARLQVQERLTEEIAGTLSGVLQPQGVGVMLRARHLCMEMRGIRKQGAYTTTTSLRGCFENPETRAEWLRGCR